VAATRAAETLCWIDISFNEKPASFSQNSWVNALRSWEATVEEENIDVHKWVSDSVCVVERTLEHYELEDSRLDLSNPIFQEHSLGVEWSSTKVPSLGNSAELSVTRLASLVQCPRKFHLKNVLKLDGEDLVDENLMDKTIENLSKDESGEVSFDAVGGSSASRGTEVHEVLEVLVKRNFILPRIVDLDSRALEGINWVSGLFKEKYFSGEYDFISEEPLKFAIFGQMISGTPDLIIQPRVRKGSSSIEIWDYKTGRYNEKKSLPYWFQLYCYGLSQSGEESQSVKLVLAFIDEQKEYSQTLTVSELKSRIFTVWDKLSKPDEINREHCASCEFGGLCFPST
jgi:CRISPR/Cas system-associated exonuclease Cas4 (RecB family)